MGACCEFHTTSVNSRAASVSSSLLLAKLQELLPGQVRESIPGLASVRVTRVCLSFGSPLKWFQNVAL